MNDNITPYVRYIGADDKDLDLFESQYVVPQGISYNSYVITDEKIAVMDTIDQRKTDEWTARLEEALEGRTPDYLIVQHMEPDHIYTPAEVILPPAFLTARASRARRIPYSVMCAPFLTMISTTPVILSTTGAESFLTFWNNPTIKSVMGLLTADESSPVLDDM